jgi:hypothetical protein
VAAVIVTLVVANSCADSTASVSVQNETEVPLTFGIVWVDGTEHPVTFVVAPGAEQWLLDSSVLTDGIVGADGCTVGDLIAYGLDGTEVARHPPPLCSDGKRGPDLWVIEASGAPSSAPPSSASL